MDFSQLFQASLIGDEIMGLMVRNKGSFLRVSWSLFWEDILDAFI